MMKHNWIFYIVVLGLFTSCEQHFQLNIPKATEVQLLKLDTLEAQAPSISIIGEFSGSTQIKLFFLNRKGETIQHPQNSLIKGDEKTGGGYFKAPDSVLEDSWKLTLWNRKKDFHKTIFLEEIILRNGTEVKHIHRKELETYFTLVNLDFDVATGALNPIKEEPMPEMIYKGLN